MFLPAVLLLILSAVVSATDTTACSAACQSPLAGLLFNGSSASANYYTSTCTNKLLVQSTFLCMRYYCSETEIADGLVYLDDTCKTYGAVRLLPWSIISNITDDQLLAWPHIEQAELYGSTIYDTPAFLSDLLFRVSLKTEVEFYSRIFYYAY